jgi:hypothetical protein
MSSQKKKKWGAIGSAPFSEKGVLSDGPVREIGLLNQAMPIISERIGRKKASGMIRAAEGALKASKKIRDTPETLGHYLSKISRGEMEEKFEAVLVFSFALTSRVGISDAVKGLEKALMDDDDTIRQMALESLVEHHWISGNFGEVGLLLKIPQLRESVAACLWAASIRLDDSEVPPESRRYLRQMMKEQADSGNRTAQLFLEEVRRMAGID